MPDDVHKMNTKPLHPLDRWTVDGVQRTEEERRRQFVEAVKLLEGATKKLKDLLHR